MSGDGRTQTACTSTGKSRAIALGTEGRFPRFEAHGLHTTQHTKTITHSSVFPDRCYNLPTQMVAYPIPYCLN